MNPMRFTSLVTLPLFALTACAVGPDYKNPPAVAMALNWSEPASTAPVDPTWWKALGDPVLTDLLKAAAAHNLDLLVAEAQIREARANRDIAFGGLFPQLNASGSAMRNELSTNGELPVRSIPNFPRRFNLFDVGFDASWEIDFWGGNRRSLEAVNARSASAQEAARSLKLVIIAEVAHTYIDLRSAQARLASAQTDAQARTDTAALVELRYKAGDASAFDQARAESQARTVVSQLAGLRSDARAAAYSLALLTGRPPEALITLAGQSATWPTTPPTVGTGLRSELLLRRPDVRQAERDLAASSADIGVATADLFPKISLIGAMGQQAQHTGDLTSELSQRYQFGPSLSWPIFSAGRIRAQIRAADARADEAASRYEKAVLSALADSETALNRYAAASSQLADLDAARAASARALDLARQRYRAGEDDLLNLLEAQSDYSATDQASLTARAAQLTALVSLYKALGGGWDDAATGTGASVVMH
jgi:NodT family efflux transporter outer membrane factor (OMF) lipoprotein